ncbi:hypothetical protein DUNSADRAFT_10142 [Dunaliella salina]|uniref:TIR domain-containing protein n=1 Tax=Dunaliella salina TaxID=3046 RepID=A0ABQ7GG00_DUNSA|nr:hypothetical protein DUNSADRAFT_10142 [Dunaliella salina]KAF5833529.1 hypothetical protein DUNSADRAFT_10142 [Dunaliella salina]KAF5833530.1 hypothetical protein DUNSADRAFT_10142 [Dunaliella salina]KAF5833531.1 hypothetical protein DUNSADRAFT_10142 [Dunaliella salina]|eukprot:KAF5833528.1 hypothetical protein DUNSADRAFT_10142 [Dunaliella salina]
MARYSEHWICKSGYDLFRFGYMARISRILEAPTKFAPLMHIACKLVCTVSDVKSCRERLRDLGIIPRVIQMIHEGTEVDMNVCTLANLSRSDSLHSTLRDVGMLDAMLKAVEVVKEDDSELTQVLFAVANVYAGSERQGGPANKLLSSYDVSLAVAARLDAVVRGSGYVHGTVVSLEEAAHGANALSCSFVLASHMCKAGVVELLVEVLQGRAEDANAVLYTCRALLNLCGLSFLHTTLLKAGVPDAIKKFAEHPDVRIQDTAKGCLLQLGQLEDQKAQAANSLLEQGAGEPGEFTYDVFLSHKRSDAKDFARALYNLFVLRGVTTFLDFEYREELQLEGGLEKLVQSCRNFVFVLTDNVLDSHWCMQELPAAVRSQRNIISVVKEGSRWPDEDGKKTLPFPGTHLLGNLDPSLKAVFMKKAIHHSDEYYSSFIDMLMKKVTANQPAASQSTAGQQQANGSSPGVQHGTNEAPLVPPQNTAGTLTATSAPTQNSSAPAFANLVPVGPQALPSASTAAAAPAPIISSPMQPQLMPEIPTHPSQGQSLPAGVMVSDPRPTFQNSGAVEMLLQLGQVERMLMGMVAEVRRDMSALAFELPRAQTDTQRQLQQMQVEMQQQMQAEVQRQVQAEVQWHVQIQVQRAQEGLRQQVFEVQRMGMQMKVFLQQQQQQQQLQQQLQQQQQQQQQQRQQACSAPFAFSRPQPRIPAFPPVAPQVPPPSLAQHPKMASHPLNPFPDGDEEMDQPQHAEIQQQMQQQLLQHQHTAGNTAPQAPPTHGSAGPSGRPTHAHWQLSDGCRAAVPSPHLVWRQGKGCRDHVNLA